MKKIFISGLGLVFILVVSGCQNAQSRAGEGAVIGGLLGATAGGIIGHQSHHGGEGAAIGLAAGALTGAIVGSQVPKSGQAAQQAPQGNNPNQMNMQQVVDLSRQGINEDVIIDKIRLTNSRFNLTANDLDYLKQQGVSEKVIDVMQGK